MNNFLISVSLFHNAISVPQMQLQVIPSHFEKCYRNYISLV